MKVRGLNMKKVSIVTTTIHSLDFLADYIDNFLYYNVNLDKLHFIIVGDNKTPQPILDKLCDVVEYWSPKAQDKWLTKCFPGKLVLIKDLLIPENDMRRRNFGYLRAIELDSDIVITIDDDNLPLKDKSWLTLHLATLTFTLPQVYSENRIINPCNLLKLNHPGIYSRGYPLSQYYFDNYKPTSGRDISLLNMGLWLNKPDVDSYMNLMYPDLKSEGFTETYSVIPSENNYIPLNTQNTSFKKKLSIFHNLYMEPSLIHRYDDIWIGLIVQRLMHKMGDSVSFGCPIVEHRRNTHNYAKDLRVEFNGIVLNDRMWRSIMDMPIESKTYKDGFLEIAYNLPKLFEDNRWFWGFFNKMKDSMELWVELIERI